MNVFARQNPHAGNADWPRAARLLVRRIVAGIQTRRRRSLRRRLIERAPDCLLKDSPIHPAQFGSTTVRPRAEVLWRAGDLAGDW